ncbi:hypothetical protein [Nannocystis radixulma]|uniref:Uncharacterized protein n=1 Tax=Nannocystis radixulma TaxID=2995305 RepID=A0ABT5BC17_9BACT|nr:hypothetical protein [Nannocystis radixulma]MDC0670612.1 hypothetical protein [Nannocystis radixulma]
MHRAAAAIVLALTLLAGCRARTSAQTPSPASAPSKAEAALELQRVLGSEHGDAILAYEGGAPEGHRSHLCVLRVTDRSVRCMVPAAVASDIPGGFDIAGISPSLRYFALRLADQLRIYETGALQVVATVPLADGDIGPVDFDPEETRAVWLQAGAPRLLTLASDEVSTSLALPAAGPGSQIRWLGSARLVAWGDGHPPIVASLDGSHEVVKLPATSWAGSSVDLRGERAVIATSSGLVAVFEPARGDHVEVLRAPADAGDLTLVDVAFDPAGRRVVAMRTSERNAEVALFDIAGKMMRLLNTPGRLMFGGFSGDGTRVAWSNENLVGDVAGGALFPSFTTTVDHGNDLAHPLDDLFLEWSGSRMLVVGGDACLRDRWSTLFCRNQQWAPFPETHRAGDVVWVGGDHILRADAREDRVTELFVTGTVDRPVLNVIEHAVDGNPTAISTVEEGTTPGP